MIADDRNQFEEMIASSYAVFIGTKKTIETTKKAFEHAGVVPGNVAFYCVRSSKKTEEKLVQITDMILKIEILKRLHIL